MQHAAAILDALTYGVGPFLLIVSICLIIAAPFSIGGKFKLPPLMILAFSFSSLGTGIGLFIGGSRDSVVSTVVPALLTFISAFTVYQFEKSERPEFRNVLPIALAMLVLSTVFGASFAASLRGEYVQAERRYEEWRLNYETVELPLRLAQLRRDLGLAAEPAPEKPATSPSPTRSPP